MMPNLIVFALGGVGVGAIGKRYMAEIVRAAVLGAVAVQVLIMNNKKISHLHVHTIMGGMGKKEKKNVTK